MVETLQVSCLVFVSASVANHNRHATNASIDTLTVPDSNLGISPVSLCTLSGDTTAWNLLVSGR